MVPDLETVKRKTQFIEANLHRLEGLGQQPFDTFVADFRNVDSAIHRLQVSVEAIIDLCAHFVARSRLKSPPDSAGLVTALVEAGMLPEAHADAYVRMIRFRHRVVHVHHDVDAQEVYRILTEHLDDYRMFISDALQIVLSTSEGRYQSPGGKP